MNIFHSSDVYKKFEPAFEIEERRKIFSRILSTYSHRLAAEDTKSEEELFKSLIKLVAYAKLIVEQDPLPLASAHLLLGEAYVVKKGYHKQGEHHSGEAVLHAENVLTSETQLRVLTASYYLLGYSRLKLGKRMDAMEAASAARNCLQELAFLSSSTDELSIRVHVLSAACGTPHPFLSTALDLAAGQEAAVYLHHMLANAYREISDTTATLKAARAAQLLAEQSSDVPLQADAARFLGQVCLESTGHGCVEEGLGLLREAIALYTTHFTGLHPITIDTYDLLIHALIRQEQYTEALEELRGTKEAKTLKYGEWSKQLATHHKILGSVYLLTDRTKEALPEFRRCLKILGVVQSVPTETTLAIKKTVQSLEANKETRPMFKLY